MKYLLHSKLIKELSQYYNDRNIGDILINQETKHSKDKTIIVYPTTRLKVYQEKEFINKLWEKSNTPYSREIFFNFSDFLSQIKHLSNFIENKSIIKEDEFYAIMKLVYDEVELSYFAKENEKPRRKINNLLSNIILGFIKKGIRITDLELKLKDNSVNSNRLKDIVLIYKTFLAKAINYTNETQEIFDLNNFIINNNIDFTTLTNDTFYFEHFKEFNRNEIDLLYTLFKHNLKLIINFKYLSKNNPNNNIFGIGQILSDSCKITELNNENEIYNNISTQLFSLNEDINITSDSKCNVNIVELEDNKKEVKYITTLVKKLIIEDNIHQKDILILARNPKAYSKLLKNEFDKNKIPLNVSDRPALKESPIIDLIINYLKLISTNFKLSNLEKILKSPFLIYDKDKININKFVSITKKYRNTYGNFRERKDYFNKILNDNKTNNQEEIRIYIAQLEYIFNLLNIKNIKSSFNKADFLSLITSFINLLKLDNLINIINKENTTFNDFLVTREKERIYSAIDALLLSIESIYDVNYKINIKLELGLRELIEELDFIKEKNKFQIRELFDTSVTFTSIEQSRGVDRKVTIICGLLEGDFPLHYKTDEVLGIDLTSTENKHIALEEELFFEAIFANESLPEQLYLTYYNKKGVKETIPSHFINEFKRVLIGQSIKFINEQESNNFINKYSLIKINNNLNNIELILNNSNINGFLGELTQTNKDRILNYKYSTFSASRLDNFYHYPYYFLYNNIFNMKELDSHGEEPMINEVGTINHQILFELYSRLSENSKLNNNLPFYLKSLNSNYNNIYPIDFSKLDDKYIKSELDKIINDVFIKFPQNEFFSLQKYISKKITLNILKKESNLQNSTTGFSFPSAFELKFGYNNDNFIIQNSHNQTINFKGNIDRIDLNFDGNNLLLSVVDYKSSDKDIKYFSAFTKKDYSFQMFLYLNAMRFVLINNYILIQSGVEYSLNKNNIIYNEANYYNINKLNLNDYYKRSKFKPKDDPTIIINSKFKEIENEIFNVFLKFDSLDLAHLNKVKKYSLQTSLLIR